MNGKYALALILALQVSMSLCDIPAPDPELVEKYNNLKTTFYSRLMTAYNKAQVALAPLMEKMGNHEQTQVAKNYVEELQTKPEFQAVVKVVTGLSEELAPLMDKLRTSALGLYGEHLRPLVGDGLNEAIESIKSVLDVYLPAQ